MHSEQQWDEHTLDLLEIAAEPFALCELKGASTLGLDRDAGATLHYVLEGRGALVVSGIGRLPLSPGTLVYVPAGRTHSLISYHDTLGGSGVSCEAAALRLAHLVEGAGEAGRMLVVCGRVTLSMRGTHGLIDLLASPMIVSAADDPVLQGAVDTLLRELAVPAPGGRAMLRALLTQCAIAMLRKRPEGLRFHPLLSDPRLSRALQVMLDNPGAPHSVESLADVAGMSRTRFALRFSFAAGTTPARLLRDLRLTRAAALLAQGDIGVDRVAQRMGFASRSAFSRAFTDRFGHPPSNRLRRPTGSRHLQHDQE
jgi:AraC-like DNA-binding protein